MKMYLEDTNKWVEVSIRKWIGNRYSEDFAYCVLFYFRNGSEHTEQQILMHWTTALSIVMRMTARCL